MALSVAGETLERYALSPRGHAELVLPWVDELMREAEVSPCQVDLIAFSRGPGSFTSLRIGISIVQGLAWGADVPVAPLSSLQITAQVAAGSGVRNALIAMDARMGEVFCGAFGLDEGGIMQPMGQEQVCTPAVAAGLVQADQLGVGNGFERYPDLAEVAAALNGARVNVWPRAAAMVPLVHDWLRTHSPLSAIDAQPVYLRDRVAQKSGASDQP